MFAPDRESVRSRIQIKTDHSRTAKQLAPAGRCPISCSVSRLTRLGAEQIFTKVQQDLNEGA